MKTNSTFHAAFHEGFNDESIAYALAANMVVFEDTAAADRDCERARRRMRHQRELSHKRAR